MSSKNVEQSERGPLAGLGSRVLKLQERIQDSNVVLLSPERLPLAYIFLFVNDTITSEQSSIGNQIVDGRLLYLLNTALFEILEQRNLFVERILR